MKMPLIAVPFLFLTSGMSQQNADETLVAIQKVRTHQTEFQNARTNTFEYYKSALAIRREFKNIELLDLSDIRKHGLDPDLIMRALYLTIYWGAEPTDTELRAMVREEMDPKRKKKAEEELRRIRERTRKAAP